MAQYTKLIGAKRRARKDGYPFEFNPQDEHALLAGCKFDEAKGYDPVEWTESFCRLSVGAQAGKLVKLHAWQSDHVMIPLFGWMMPNKVRRYRSAYISIAKKNYKSTLASSLALYMLLMDGEEGAHVYLAACASDQTDNVFRPAAQMVYSSPTLEKRLKVVEHAHVIKRDGNNFIKGMAAQDATSQGVDALLVVVDELHAWTSARSQGFYDSLRYAGKARRQPIFFQITTRGDDQDTLCGIEDDYAKKVIAGNVVDFRHLALVYEPPDAENIETAEAIKAANPVIETQEQIDLFLSEWQAAQRKGAQSVAQFKRYNFNLWTKNETKYLNDADWAACAERGLVPYEGAKVWGGLDISSKEDLTALAWCWMSEDGKQVNVITRHFAPQRKIDELKLRAQENYYNWQQTGDLIACEGDIIDHEQIKNQIMADINMLGLNIVDMAFDRWNADQIAKWIDTELGIPVVQFRQGFKSFSYPTKEFKNSILSRRIRHDGNMCMAWMISNTWVVEDVQDNVKPVKRIGKKKFKIDGVVAAIMAFAQMLSDDDNLSRYNKEDAEITTI
jgi:phage terminase large subunit-like protein